ncbi:MAG: hypothetical protein V2A73_09740 [Pseudomonadota bacterium]
MQSKNHRSSTHRNRRFQAKEILAQVINAVRIGIDQKWIGTKLPDLEAILQSVVVVIVVTVVANTVDVLTPARGWRRPGCS